MRHIIYYQGTENYLVIFMYVIQIILPLWQIFHGNIFCMYELQSNILINKKQCMLSVYTGVQNKVEDFLNVNTNTNHTGYLKKTFRTTLRQMLPQC